MNEPGTNGMPDTLKLALAAMAPQLTQASETADQYKLVPQGYGLVKVPQTRAKPSRTVAAVTVLTLADFVAYVKRHAVTPSVFVTRDADSVTAVGVLDYHVGKDPAWGSHRVQLDLEMSEELRPWVQGAGKLWEQVAFAEFVEDHNADVHQPQPADLVELALSLKGRTDAKWEMKRNTQNGTGVLHFEEETSTGDVTVPRELELFLPILHGEESRSVKVLLGYRVGAGKVGFTWRIPALAARLREALKDVRKIMASELAEVPVMEGAIDSMGQEEKPAAVVTVAR